MRAKRQVVEGVISQIKLFNAGSGWRTLTCVRVAPAELHYPQGPSYLFHPFLYDLLQEEIGVGDWVLVHVGFAIQKPC